MTGEISVAHQGGIAVATVFILDYLKKANWFPWISSHTETLNRVVSILIAFGTAAGLRMAGDSGHGWTLSIPPLAVISDTVMHAFEQFGGQELLHKILGNHQMNRELLDIAQRIMEKQQEAPQQGG